MIYYSPLPLDTAGTCPVQPCRWYMWIGYSGLYIIEDTEQRSVDDSKLAAAGSSTACEKPVPSGLLVI